MCLASGNIVGDREVVHELVSRSAIGSFEQLNSATESSRRHPNVAVENPNNVATSFTVGFAEIANLGVRTNILLADYKLRVDVGVLLKRGLDHRDRGIGRRRYAENKLILVAWVVKETGRGQANIEIWVASFNRS